jgi:catalase-peroxidase
MGLGWKNKFGKGNAEDTITSGLEGAWTSAPARWSHMYLSNLYAYEWELTKSPAGAKQWVPKTAQAKAPCPMRTIKGKSHAPIMFTTDIALRMDPIYGKISKRFLENPKEFETPLPKPGSSSRTATWARSPATSALKCRRKPDLAGPRARRRS